MKNILITNDDGYLSPALQALVESISDLGRVLVVAPASEKSACGHGLTLTRPLSFIKIKDNFYKLEDGTPSDCVYLALNTLYKGIKPDLIISGINIGSNMGEDVTYSGTVAGAMEGAIHKIPSIAISQVLDDKNTAFEYDFSLAKEVAKGLVKELLNRTFPLSGRKLLNINIPQIKKDKYKGIKITQLGYRIYGNDAHLHRNPRGYEYYWLGLHPLNWEERKDNNSDFKAVFEGYTSITPIMLDMTSYEDMQTLNNWASKF
ncbi:5'/3'-nucleotidase SurE [Helicobacter sp. MIT 14-3879]|uniref:5'/3'-nucleotidase SurE n=1 Tax=Helicobacter sp. MIT 14-3879 TaxID=2040649 RepID=UPI000E1F6204|nr:5'/3'-nucleotidase SurE [Helicobacter sp. MIT 14-3879]RDU64792.1 5'/3'-nucleotidase SurE [Helicobacter sp. MIT 14-3879]